MELCQDSCIRGYHIIWNAVLRQVLLTKGELAMQHGHNRHSIAVNSKKHSGKTPILRLCSMFIDQGGDIALCHAVFTISHITIIVTVHKIEWILILRCATSRDY